MSSGINNTYYVQKFNENLKQYNLINNTNYTFEDVQRLFIDCRTLPEKYSSKCSIHCMCGHPIKEGYEIINPATNHKMILGSSCIETYMINSRIICDCGNSYKVINNKIKKCSNCRLINKSCSICKCKIQIKKSQKDIIDTCYKCIIEYEQRRNIKSYN